jgi:hypothetical protein
MKNQVSTPVAIGIVVVILIVIGVVYFMRSHGPTDAPVDAKGIPQVPVQARPGADAMSKLWKGGMMPPKTQP